MQAHWLEASHWSLQQSVVELRRVGTSISLLRTCNSSQVKQKQESHGIPLHVFWSDLLPRLQPKISRFGHRGSPRRVLCSLRAPNNIIRTARLLSHQSSVFESNSFAKATRE